MNDEIIKKILSLLEGITVHDANMIIDIVKSQIPMNANIKL